MALKSYRELVVWQKAMDLVVAVYQLSASLPSGEKYGLTSQMQRAAVSVPANIAEGYGRVHRGDYLRHLSIARGSLAELETHVAIAVRLEFLGKDAVMEVWELTQEVGKLLGQLIRSLEPDRRGAGETLDPRP